MATFCEYVYDYLSDSLGKSSEHKGSKQISLRMEIDNFPYVWLIILSVGSEMPFLAHKTADN